MLQALQLNKLKKVSCLNPFEVREVLQGSKAVYRASDGKDYPIADLKHQFEQELSTAFTGN